MNINITNVFDWDDAILLFFYDLGTKVWNLLIQMLSGWTADPVGNEAIDPIWQNIMLLLENEDFKNFSMALLSMFFLWDVVDKLCRQAENISPFSLLLYFVKLIFCSYVVTNLKSIITYISTFGKEVAGVINDAGFSVWKADIEEGVRNSIEVYLQVDQLDVVTGFMTTIFALIYMVVMISCALSVVGELIKIYQDLCFAIPFAPLVVGTVANSGHWGQIAYQYFKTVIGRFLSFAAIMIMINVAAAFANYISANVINGVFSITNNAWTQFKFFGMLIMVNNLIKAILISRSVSGIENRIHALGL